MAPSFGKVLISPRVPGGPARIDRRSPIERFSTSEAAWFWTIASLAAHREGIRGCGPQIRRSFNPDDIVRCLDHLYRQQQIDLLHGRILRIWGERQTSPHPRCEGEKCDHQIWTEVMQRLEAPLRAKGLIPRLLFSRQNRKMHLEQKRCRCSKCRRRV